jgi:hypothetical protein
MTARNHTLHDLWHSQAVTNSGIMTKLWKTANMTELRLDWWNHDPLNLSLVAWIRETGSRSSGEKRDGKETMGTRIHRCVALH